LLDRKKNM